MSANSSGQKIVVEIDVDDVQTNAVYADSVSANAVPASNTTTTGNITEQVPPGGLTPPAKLSPSADSVSAFSESSAFSEKVVPLRALHRKREAHSWQHETLAGRLVELSSQRAAASLSMAMQLIADTQREGETVAWISGGTDLFFAPDAADAGIDLEALPVISLRSASDAIRVADRILRSGAFGLVVLDLGNCGPIRPPMVSRLVKLAQLHNSALVALTEKPESGPSIHSMVSLRVQARRVSHEPEWFCGELQVLKDKRCGPGAIHREVFRGPPGLY